MLRFGQGKSRAFKIIAVAFLLMAAAGFTVSRTLFDRLPRELHSLRKYDTLGRLVLYPGKKETACPRQTGDTAVLLVIGQSNAANSGATRFATQYPLRVFNYFDGACFVAASPLLGATSEGGAFAVPLADQLIKDGTYQSVVIIASAIGSSEIARWQPGGDLNGMLLGIVGQAGKDYRITDVIWHQGETDFQMKTSAEAYAASFHALLDSLRTAGIVAPVFIAVATKCGVGNGWDQHNPVAAAQKTLADDKTVFLAADTDALLDDHDRQKDGCHFSESGQLKTAAAYTRAIENHPVK